MFSRKFIIKPTISSVGQDLQSVVEVLLKDSDREFTADQLTEIEDYVAERVKHLNYLRKQASK
jgi:hypothetical protein